MLKNKRLPELILEGFSSPFKKKPSPAKFQSADENNELLIKTLIDKNIRHNQSSKSKRHKSDIKTDRPRNSPLK